MATKTQAKQKTAVDEMPAKDIRRHALECMESIEKNKYDVMVDVSIIYEGDLFKSWGFEKFDDYCEQELGLGRERYWWVQMGQTIRAKNITKERIGDMGWTKFKEIVSIIGEKTTDKQIDKYLAKAQDMTYEETKDFVREERSRIEKTPGAKQKKVTLSFKLINDQADTIETALTTASDLIGLEQENLGVALEYICADFLANRNESAAHVAKIQKKLHIPKAEKPKAHKKHAHAGKGKDKEAVKGNGHAEKTEAKAPKKEAKKTKASPKKHKDAELAGL